MSARVSVLGRTMAITAVLGMSVLSGVALSGIAEAAAPTTTVTSSPQLFPQQGSPEYREGMRNGMRDGFQDGQNDARLDCVMRGGKPKNHSFAHKLSEFDKGYSAGYSQGYVKGFDQIRCKKHH